MISTYLSSGRRNFRLYSPFQVRRPCPEAEEQIYRNAGLQISFPWSVDLFTYFTCRRVFNQKSNALFETRPIGLQNICINHCFVYACSLPNIFIRIGFVPASLQIQGYKSFQPWLTLLVLTACGVSLIWRLEGGKLVNVGRVHQ